MKLMAFLFLTTISHRCSQLGDFAGELQRAPADWNGLDRYGCMAGEINM